LRAKCGPELQQHDSQLASHHQIRDALQLLYVLKMLRHNARLLSHGFLVEQEDGRKKRVTPTNQAYKRIALLSDCMGQATQ
jgi:hypothetical protein